ncbi:MAG TPA: hypothetical protein DCM21_04995 [Butyrivibrio sp.]|nr:hypothetical protein [Butyrivibrio sp.]
MKSKMNVLGRVLSLILAVALTVTTVFSGFSRKTLAAGNNGKYGRKYTVEFVNSNGAVISTQNLRYGEKIVKPGNPKYPGTKDIYEYTFAGWDKEVSDVCKGNATYTAEYDKSIKIAFYKYNIEASSRKDLFDYEYITERDPKYFTKLGSTITVTNDFTGYENIISMLEEAYIKGKSDTIYGNNNEEFVKSFVSLTAEKAGVKEDAVDCWYVLKRETDGWHVDGGNLKDYTVKFVDYDDSTISERIYNANENIVIPSNPVRESDETYNYTFTGWDKEISKEAVSDAVYKAVYESSYIDYTVRFLNEDGSVISEATYHYGDNVVVPANPAKAADETYTYKFAGWDKEVTSVKGNADYTAVYTDEYNKYIVRFLNEDGTVILKSTYHYGDDVVVPADPIKTADETYTYKFVSWDKEVTSVKGNADYKAVYESSYIDYTVRFLNEDGSVISEATYHYGDDVVVPANPVKAADETYTYTFAGWDKEVTSVKGNVDYKAVYESSYIDYTVRFLNEDGSVISETTYHYGDDVVIPVAPAKAADEKYTYTFAGWDKEVTLVKGNVDYKAVYESSYIDYTVRFLNEDGSVITETTYHYGDDVVIPANPVKASDETYTYKFAGWDKEVTSVKGNADYTAIYESSYIDYTVRFLNEDGSVISEATYHYGDNVVVPANPAKAADETYTYKFAGWDKEVTSVKGNADYTAVYTDEYNKYIVRFLNEDGTVILKSTYHYGDDVVIPVAPAKAADETYTYKFAGWDKEVTSVKGNADYTAIYEPSYIDYTVRFLNEDGSVITETTYHYGDNVVIPANPAKAADETYTYTFAGWDKEVTSVKGNADYTAVYESSYIDYTVRFLNEDRSVITEATYHYGDDVVIPANPVKAADETYTYKFAGWDKDVTSVRGNVDYTAVYTDEYNKYIVRFLDEDGTVILNATYHYGEDVVIPANPVKAADETYTYTFAGWDKEVTSVKGNADYTAVYESSYIDYTVRFLNEDGSVISEATYHYGEDVTVPADPAKAADEKYTYTFAGWDKEVTSVKENVDYTATYSERLNRIPEVEGDEDIVPDKKPEINPGNNASDDNKPSVRPVRKPEVEADEDVATGDSNMTLYIAILGLSAATLAVIMGRKKEQDI